MAVVGVMDVCAVVVEVSERLCLGVGLMVVFVLSIVVGAVAGVGSLRLVFGVAGGVRG